MLDTIKDGFDSIFKFFKSILSFFKMLIGGMVDFFETIPMAVTFAGHIVPYMPAFLLVFFTVTLSCLIVKLILDLL